MTKTEFMTLMLYPPEWEASGMYPDELFEAQVKAYQPGNEQWPEDERNGAFHWWLRRGPTKEELQQLLRLAAIDPQPLLGEALRRYFRRADAFDADVEQLDHTLFGNRPGGA